MKKHLAYSVSLVLSFAINVIFMNMGIFNISQHLFYIPILLGVFFYGKKGVYFSALTSICYFISVAIFDKDSSEMLATFLRVVIFIAIAVLIYFLNTRYKTARAKLDSFFKINADMMCTFDKNLNFINVNKAFQNTLGYHRSEIEDHKLFDFIHPLDVDEILAKISEEKENTEFVCRVKCKDGSYKNIEWRSFYYDNVIYATPRDITDRIKLISQLKNDEYRINIVENLAKVGSWEIDILTKYCVYSSGFYSIFGIKPENGVTSSEQLKKFVCPEDFDYVYKKFQKAFEDRRDYSFECRIKRNDDNITWVHSKGTFKVDKETGRTKHVGFVMDITDHKLAEKMQINSLKRYASLTEISRFEADSDEKLLNYIILQAVELTDSNFGFLLKCDEKNRYFIVATKLWNTDKFIIGFDESEILKRVIETKKPIIVNKVKRSDLSCFGNIEAERLMITPVHEGDSITAVAIVYDKKASYDETDSLQFMLFIRNAWEQVKRKRAENELVEEKKWFETTLMSIGEGVIATDGNGVIQLVNEIAVKLTGIAKSDAIGKKIWDVYNVIKQSDKEQLVISKVLMGTDRETEIDEDLIFETKYGYPIDIEVKASAIKVSDKIAGYVIIFRDVTEKKESEREIAYLTYHDKLTGLYNRRFFEEELKKMDKVENYPISILVGDVNGLKLINDAFGHLAGDSLLIAAGEIMKSVCHAGDIAARWGGDEFIILMPRTETEAAEQVAENIKKICASTFVSNVNLSIALGSATKHSADDDIHEIIKQADDT
ncbi:MAG: PAS domain S-box protein, partial [Bacillota bacterium]|nr:PAS domain S-box protein [Bacillota bacterium]